MPIDLPAHYALIHLKMGHLRVHKLTSTEREISLMYTVGTPDILPEAPDKTPSLNMDEPAHHISLSSVSFFLFCLSQL